MLRCAEGRTNKEVAAELGIAHATVNRWRSRFITLRLDGLMDEPRPGRPPSVLLDQVEDVLVATLESTPGKDTHWSRASMAKHSGLSKSTVGRIWKKFDLKPHLQDSFKLPTDPQYVAKVVDVAGLYHHPPEKAVVLCVDEKSHRDAFSRQVVAWETSTRADADLVLTALECAPASREIELGQLIHHADHGCQYTSIKLTTAWYGRELRHPRDQSGIRTITPSRRTCGRWSRPSPFGAASSPPGPGRTSRSSSTSTASITAAASKDASATSAPSSSRRSTTPTRQQPNERTSKPVNPC